MNTQCIVVPEKTHLKATDVANIVTEEDIENYLKRDDLSMVARKLLLVRLKTLQKEQKKSH